MSESTTPPLAGEPERAGDESGAGSAGGVEPVATQPAATEPGTSTDSGTATGRAGAQDTEDLLARTRTSQTWIALIVFALVLILLLIFVLQNTERVEVSYLSADFSMPLAVAMLLSAIAGVLLAAIAGTLRILQLRRRVRKSQQT